MATTSEKVKTLIEFLTHNKNLTHQQRAKFSRLLARDLNGYDSTSKNEEKVTDPIINGRFNHEPLKIVRFLHQFTEYNCKALKYTTHFWDKNPSTNEYDYTSFDQFKSEYIKILDNGENKLDDIRPLCEHLWQLVRNFLVRDDGKYPWSEYKFRIGYNKYLKKWMDENPGIQPFSMPLKEFPEEFQPKQKVKGKTLVYFNDVVNIFKNCIEFRDNALYYAVKSIFRSSDHNIDSDALETLRGVSLFTDTELVKSALQTIAGNIFQRPQYPDIVIECNNVKRDQQPSIELRITQVGSFAEKEITESKIIGKTEDSMFWIIKQRLKNLCDFCVESAFKVQGETKACRLRYLASNEDDPWFEELPPSSCKGFTYVLNFKTYSKS